MNVHGTKTHRRERRSTKMIVGLTLGVVTSLGGYLEAGSIATAAQAGATFGYALLWPLALGTVCLISLVEMSGRLAAVSGHTVAGAMRQRFGFGFFALPLVVNLLVSYLVLASEIAGISTALELATAIDRRWWAIPAALLCWLVLWMGTFGLIENGVSTLGLVTVGFAVAAVKLHPDWRAVGAALAPSLPKHDLLRYWYLAVSVIGATITPYLLFFYSSGAVEDRWTRRDLATNRVVATVGMTFGSALSAAVLIVAALVLLPQGARGDSYAQLAHMLDGPLGRWGFGVFVAALGIACFGAALEVSLATAYLMAQGFGWRWSEDVAPREAPRFTMVYTLLLPLAALPIVLGANPLTLTVFSMALASASLPFVVGPLFVLMNDRAYVGRFRNGVVGNAVVIFTTALAFALAIVTIPLVIAGG